MICVQVNQDSESFTEFKKKLEEKHPDLQFKEVKNSLMSQVVLKGTKYSDLSALFVGPTSIVYHNNPETYFADAKALLSAIKKRKVKSDLITLGGIFQGQMVNFIQLEQMNQAISEVHVRSSLVDMLMSPSRNIIKILKSPLDGMVKALDFQAKKEGGEKAE